MKRFLTKQFAIDVLKEFPIVVLHAWRLAAPFFLALMAYGFKDLADGEPSAGAARAGNVLAAGLVVWAIDLAYQRGRSARDNHWAGLVTRMFAEDRIIEIVTKHRHEHYATPAAAEAMKAEGWNVAPDEKFGAAFKGETTE